MQRYGRRPRPALAELHVCASTYLGLVVLFKEVVAGSSSRPMRTLARGVDLSLAPLLVAFVVTIGLRTLSG